MRSNYVNYSTKPSRIKDKDLRWFRGRPHSAGTPSRLFVTCVWVVGAQLFRQPVSSSGSRTPGSVTGARQVKSRHTYAATCSSISPRSRSSGTTAILPTPSVVLLGSWRSRADCSSSGATQSHRLEGPVAGPGVPKAIGWRVAGGLSGGEAQRARASWEPTLAWRCW